MRFFYIAIVIASLLFSSYTDNNPPLNYVTILGMVLVAMCFLSQCTTDIIDEIKKAK